MTDPDIAPDDEGFSFDTRGRDRQFFENLLDEIEAILDTPIDKSKIQPKPH